MWGIMSNLDSILKRRDITLPTKKKNNKVNEFFIKETCQSIILYVQ